METIRTERTSKWLKGGMVLGILLMAASLAFAYQTWGTANARMALYGVGGGAGVWLASRFMAWWQYG